MMIESIRDTLRMSVRSLVRRPFYSAVAITILTLGLAASTAVVTYINSSFSPIPGIRSERLVQIYGVERDDPFAPVSYLDYADYAAAAGDSFKGLAAMQMSFAGGLSHAKSNDQVFGQAVSGNYFSLLGVEMALGRSLGPQDDRPAKPQTGDRKPLRHREVCEEGAWIEGSAMSIRMNVERMPTPT